MRVSESTRARAASLATQSESSIGAVIERALDADERAEFWSRTGAAVAASPDAGGPEGAWERTVRDGLLPSDGE